MLFRSRYATRIKYKTGLRDVAGAMPPWFVEKDIGIQEFKNDMSLTDEEVATLAAWVDNGAPEGDPADMPPPRVFDDSGDWTIRPDLVGVSEEIELSPEQVSGPELAEQPDGAGSIETYTVEFERGGDPLRATVVVRLDDGRRTVANLEPRPEVFARLLESEGVGLRGRARVLRDIEALGIDREGARAAIEAVFSEVDEATVLERALARRLHGPVQDLAHFRRLHQYLLRQGFPPDLAVAALRARSVF